MTDTTTRFIQLPTEMNFVILVADVMARYDLLPEGQMLSELSGEFTKYAEVINKVKSYAEMTELKVSKLEELVLAMNSSIYGSPGYDNQNLSLRDRWTKFHVSIKGLMPLYKLKKWVDGIRRSLINSPHVGDPYHWNTLNLGVKIESATVGEFSSNAAI